MSNEEVLVVVSKLKKYIKEQAGMNCAANVAPVISQMVRDLTDAAIAAAAKDRRKTVKDRDFTWPAPASEGE